MFVLPPEIAFIIIAFEKCFLQRVEFPLFLLHFALFCFVFLIRIYYSELSRDHGQLIA